MKASMPSRVGDIEDEDEDDDDDDLIGDAEDLMSPPISDAEDAFVGSGSEDEDAPTAVEGQHGDTPDSDDDEESSGAGDLDLIDHDTTDSVSEDWTGFRGGVDIADNKRKRGNDGAPSRRKKRRSLPTFASYEDYARMIEDGPEDNL
jgi:ribosome biogenesis protein MAK21